MIKLILYDMHCPRASTADILLVHRLENANHPVIKLSEYHGLMMRVIMVKAWLEFDTEAEAAIFKLTHF